MSNRVRVGVRWWTRLRCWLFGHGNADPRAMASFDGRKTWEHLCERCGGRMP